LEWIDEEAALYSIVQLENQKVVTKYISEIDFKASAKQGDVIEIGIKAIKFGKASITLSCEVRNMMTRETIITISNIVMVNIGSDGKVLPHGKTQIEYVSDRI
jgi:acyl-CoA hydrolase